jgi:hypothetical protein
MAIEIEEIKQIPQAAKDVVGMVDTTKEVIVQQTEPYINWENVVNSIDQSHLTIAFVIFLIAILARPILALAKYILIFGVIFFLVQHYA